MEFVFESDMKRGDPPNSPDILAAPSRFSGGDKSFQNASSTGTSKIRSQGRRKLPDSFSDIEFNEPAKKARKRTTGPKVNYVKPVKKQKRKKLSNFDWGWTKFGWAICGLLVLRLIFMESGLVDYQSMHRTLEQKQNSLELLRVDNADLIKEIHTIKTSPSYQKKLARDHLGVIAKDEYLILFSRESQLSSSI